MFARHADPIDSMFTAKVEIRLTRSPLILLLVNDVMYLVKNNKSPITPISQSRSAFIYPVFKDRMNLNQLCRKFNV